MLGRVKWLTLAIVFSSFVRCDAYAGDTPPVVPADKPPAAQSEPLPSAQPSAEQIAAWKNNNEKFLERKKFLDNFRDTLKREFTGYDPYIEQVVNRVSELMQNPESKRPLQPIVLIGMPGIGKSKFIERVGALLHLQNNTWGYTAGPGDATLKLGGLTQAAKPVDGGIPGVTGIFYIDEIQRVVAPNFAIDENELRQQLAREYGEKDQDRIEQRIKQIKQERANAQKEANNIIETLREATGGSGEISTPATTPVKDYLKRLDLFYSQYAAFRHQSQANLNAQQARVDKAEKDLERARQELAQLPVVDKSALKALQDELTTLDRDAESMRTSLAGLQEKQKTTETEEKLAAAELAQMEQKLTHARTEAANATAETKDGLERAALTLQVEVDRLKTAHDEKALAASSANVAYLDLKSRLDQAYASQREKETALQQKTGQAQRAEENRSLQEHRVKDWEDSVVSEKSKLKDIYTQVFNNASYQSSLPNALQQLLNAYPELLDKGDLQDWETYAPPDSIALSRMLEHPDKPFALLDAIRARAKDVRPEPKQYVGGVLWFVMGNDVPYNEKVLELAGDTNDPDRIRDAELRFRDSPEAEKMKLNFAHQILGDNADWASLASRLNFPWQYITPWGKDQWKHFAKDVLKEDARVQASKLFANHGIKTEIEYDPSVEEVLYKYGVRPVHGPRVMSSAPGDLLGMLKIGIVDGLIAHTKGEGWKYDKPFKIKVHYDFDKKEFVAQLVGGNDVTAPKTIAVSNAALLERAIQQIHKPVEVNGAKPSSRELDQLSHRQAARILIGMLWNQARPNDVVFDPKHPTHIDSFWPPIEGELKPWEYDRNQILMLLAGVASDRIRLGNKTTQLSKADLELAQEAVRHLAQGLEAEGKTPDNKSAVSPNGTVDLSKVVPKTLQDTPIFRDLIAGDESATLERTRKDLQNLLEKNKAVNALWHEIAGTLMRKGSISSAEIGQLFAKKRVRRNLAQDLVANILANPPGIPVNESCPVMMEHLESIKYQNRWWWRRLGERIGIFRIPNPHE